MNSSLSIFQLISKRFVKPILPTPTSLKIYKLSLLDQEMTRSYMPLALFYPNPHHSHRANTSQISSLLEESLSKTLAYYYPFAGRLSDNIHINCSDMGVRLLETKINCKMSEILEAANINAHDIVFPRGLPWNSGHDEPSLVVAQLSHFDCGGIAISVCINHKLGDGYTLCNFINDWAVMTRQSCQVPSPQFTGASILPPKDNPPITPLFEVKQRQKCIITRRFVFDLDKLSQLKAKATAESRVQNPTRVETVTALLYKCAISAAKECSGSFKPSMLLFSVSLRELIGLPATQNYIGNIVSTLHFLTSDEGGTSFSRLVSEIRRVKVECYEKYKGKKRNELASTITKDAEEINVLKGKNDMDEYYCSSLCRFPTDRIDFGWGRPIRVNIAALPWKNSFVLMDNHNPHGIQAIVAAEEKVMSAIERDPELCAFVS